MPALVTILYYKYLLSLSHMPKIVLDITGETVNKRDHGPALLNQDYNYQHHADYRCIDYV